MRLLYGRRMAMDDTVTTTRGLLEGMGWGGDDLVAEQPLFAAKMD
jgi:hypothetical protein